MAPVSEKMLPSNKGYMPLVDPDALPQQSRRAPKIKRIFKNILIGILVIALAVQIFRMSYGDHRRHFFPGRPHRFPPWRRPGGGGGRNPVFSPHPKLTDEDKQSICPQYDALAPPTDEKLDAQYQRIMHDDKFRTRAAEYLSRFVQVKSESFDDSGPVGEDPRWDVFADVHNYLENSFPLIHKHLEKQTVNTFGLLYTWKGSDENLKPLLFLGHQDTVPVETHTIDHWTHPPWEGYIDDKYVYGRGSVDDKGRLLSIMIAIERLLKNGFVPKRSVLLSFGFDEESKGIQGAAHLANRIEGIYGPDSIEMIVDEGGNIADAFGTNFGAITTSEKGYLDVNITLTTPGGHSSTPPGLTNAEILAEIVKDLKHVRYHPHLTPRNPHFNLLKCAAAYSPYMPTKLRDAVLSIKDVPEGQESRRQKFIAHQLAERAGYEERYILQTSQATTIFKSGIKANELPESGFVLINHRIAVEEDVDLVKNLTAKVIRRQARKYGLKLNLFGEVIDDKGSMGELEVTSLGNLNPAPTTPTFGNRLYETFSGTMKHVWAASNARRSSPDQTSKDLVVTPNLMRGNTDTRYYWSLTKNIYRYAHALENDSVNIHTVDEKLGIDSLVTNIAFYFELIRNIDAFKS